MMKTPIQSSSSPPPSPVVRPLGPMRRLSDYARAEGGEYKEAGREVWVFARTHTWKATLKTVVKRKYWIWWALLVFTIVTSVLLSNYHTQIIVAIKPYKSIIRKAPAVWLIPIVVLIIISFPPLFGHELVILVVGVIYSIPVAFAIACAGTFLGELALFYAAKSLLSERARKVETQSIVYACLAKLMRDGGVKTSILVRFSAVPGHITTAIQSTIGISVWVYAIAAIVSLPKQFALVYVGFVFGQTSMPIEQWRDMHPNEPDSAYYSADETAAQRRKISFIVFAATFLATLIAFVFIWMQIRKIRPVVAVAMEAKKLEEEQLAGRSSGDEEETIGMGNQGYEMAEAKVSLSSTIVDRRHSFGSKYSSRALLGVSNRSSSGSNFSLTPMPVLSSSSSPLGSEEDDDELVAEEGIDSFSTMTVTTDRMRRGSH